MNKEFKAVSMHCTKEQFQQLRPYLEKIHGVKITDINGFETWPILVNNYRGEFGVISNAVLGREDACNRTYIGAFNAKAFIEACGGEWAEETPSMKGKWFKYINVVTPNFTFWKWYQCCKDSPLEPSAFIDNLGNESGYEKNDVYFDLSNPMDFNPDTVTPETPQSETKFKEVPFNWETYLEYKDKGAYLEYCDEKAIEAHKFNLPKADYPIVAVFSNGSMVTFTIEGFQILLNGKDRLKLFIPTAKKTITVWAVMVDGEIFATTFTKDFAEKFQKHGHKVIELTKEIEA